MVGCSAFRQQVNEPISKIKNGQIEEGLAILKPLAEKEGDDQLLYLLEYATALQIAGRYQESNKYFLQADRLTDLNDYHSASRIVGATLGGEQSLQYKGESYEKFLINTMLAINFLMLNDRDSALVEARRINEKISKMKMDGRDPYEQSPFAKYLSGLVWESDRRFDDAYISYNDTYKLNPTIPFLPKDLLVSAKKASRLDAYQKWKREFPSVTEPAEAFDRQMGELILIYQQGWGPIKKPNPENFRLPVLVPTWSETRYAEMRVQGYDPILSSSVYNIESVAIDTLQKDYGAIVARRLGGIVAKEIVADQIRQKNELLGLAAWATMHILDQADTRNWSSLPQKIHFARIYLPAGTYTVNVNGLDQSKSFTGESKQFSEVLVQAGRKTFINWRSLK